MNGRVVEEQNRLDLSNGLRVTEGKSLLFFEDSYKINLSVSKDDIERLIEWLCGIIKSDIHAPNFVQFTSNVMADDGEEVRLVLHGLDKAGRIWRYSETEECWYCLSARRTPVMA